LLAFYHDRPVVYRRRAGAERLQKGEDSTGETAPATEGNDGVADDVATEGKPPRPPQLGLEDLFGEEEEDEECAHAPGSPTGRQGSPLF